MAIEEVVTAPRSPWQNAYVERIIGSIRRECLNHVIVFDACHLRRVLSAYFQYYHRSRTHLSLQRIVQSPDPYSRRLQAQLWSSRRSAVCTTATSGSQPDLFAVTEPAQPFERGGSSRSAIASLGCHGAPNPCKALRSQLQLTLSSNKQELSVAVLSANRFHGWMSF